MKKTCKKALAMLLAISLLLTMGISAMAAPAGTMEIELSKEDLYSTTGKFTATVKLTAEVTGAEAAQLTLKYNPQVIAPCDDDGNILTAWGDTTTNPVLAKELPTGFSIMVGKITEVSETEENIEFQLVRTNPMGSELIPAVDGVIEVISFNFTTVGVGDTKIQYAGETTNSKFTVPGALLPETIYATYEAELITVMQMPNYPSVDNLALKDGDELKFGETVTADYDWNNGNVGDGAVTNNDNQSVVTWFVGGEAVETGVGFASFDIDDADYVGKELSYSVWAKTSRPANLNGFEGEEEGTEESGSLGIIMPADDYAPVAEVELGKVTIKKEAVASVNFTTVYDVNYTENTTFEWYVVAGAADEAAAIAAVEAFVVDPETASEGITVTKIEGETTATTSKTAFDNKDYKGAYAVVRVGAIETVGGVDYPLVEGDPATPINYAYDVAEIKAAGGSAVQGGASLVTGGTTTPSKPVDPEDPEKPGTEDPEKPGTEEPAGSEDPAGTANEVGAAAFTDVDKEAYAWAYDSIDVLAKAGVIKGMTADTFGPELTTTNAQVIALVARIAGLTAEEGATTDKVDAEHWVAGEMAIADANGILTVFGDGAIEVEGETTREIAFTLLYNALKAAGVELPEVAEAIEFTDAASISEGCVEAINALVKAGIINGMGDGTVAPKATITRAQLAKILGLADALIAE